MESSSKLVVRKQDIKKLEKAKEIEAHLKNETCEIIREIDISHN